MSLAFELYIGIDYSGAQTPSSSLKGLCVYSADRLTGPQELQPPSSSRKYWTRKGIATWLVEKLSEGLPMLVGIDHGFSFPFPYNTSNNMDCHSTGHHSSMISSATGRLMKISTLILCGKATAETVLPDLVILAGGD